MLSLYRAALHIRREHPGLASDAFRWLPGPDGTLLFERGFGLRCAVNLSARAIDLPPDARVVLASTRIDGFTLPPDGAAWFERPA
jgi:alpha-glucosidase